MTGRETPGAEREAGPDSGAAEGGRDTLVRERQ